MDHLESPSGRLTWLNKPREPLRNSKRLPCTIQAFAVSTLQQTSCQPKTSFCVYICMCVATHWQSHRLDSVFTCVCVESVWRTTKVTSVQLVCVYTRVIAKYVCCPCKKVVSMFCRVPCQESRLIMHHAIAYSWLYSTCQN